jgi:hypothetical protein
MRVRLSAVHTTLTAPYMSLVVYTTSDSAGRALPVAPCHGSAAHPRGWGLAQSRDRACASSQVASDLQRRHNTPAFAHALVS